MLGTVDPPKTAYLRPVLKKNLPPFSYFFSEFRDDKLSPSSNLKTREIFYTQIYL